MIEISADASDLDRLRSELLADEVERCAVLVASQIVRSDGLTRLLVRERIDPLPSDYLIQTVTRAELSPSFVARLSKLAKLRRSSLIFVHTHPFQRKAHFSAVDDAGERALATLLRARQPEQAHAALLLTTGDTAARGLGTLEPARVVALGENRIVVTDSPTSPATEPAAIFDRQIRAFGTAGQREISELKIGIVGLGGTGSLIAEQLAHLGVRRFTLIDPDVIETSNLNRVVGAAPQDVGSLKVAIAARNIQRIAPLSEVAEIAGDVIYARTAKALLDVDFIFGCTDSHGSRSVLQQVAYQYFIPCIDMGSTIVAKGGQIASIYGRVQLLGPGFACLWCAGLLDSEEVRRDMMTAFERTLDPYIQGSREPAPAVISINGTVASLAVTMFMAFVTGIPSRARYLLYNAKASSLRNAHAEPNPNCYVCSAKGALGKGDLQALFARQD